MKPDTITVVPTCLIISIWAYRRMGVHCCNRIGVSLYGCNRMSVLPSGGRRFMKPVVNVGVGVVTFILIESSFLCKVQCAISKNDCLSLFQPSR